MSRARTVGVTGEELSSAIAQNRVGLLTGTRNMSSCVNALVSGAGATTAIQNAASGASDAAKTAEVLRTLGYRVEDGASAEDVRTIVRDSLNRLEEQENNIVKQLMSQADMQVMVMEQYKNQIGVMYPLAIGAAIVSAISAGAMVYMAVRSKP